MAQDDDKNHNNTLQDSTISQLKAEFIKKYEGNGHIKEVIPKKTSDLIPIENSKLEKLHEFAKHNPIYYNSFEMEILGITCTVYEGDINQYWINSVKPWYK